MAEEIGDIDGIGSTTEEKIREKGIDSIDDLAQASVEEITGSGISESRAKDFINKAKQNAVIIQSGTEVEEEYKQYTTVSTGIESLDEAMEGGWEEEAVVSLWGESGCGKTQLAMKALVEAVKQTGKPGIYIETEKNRFRPQRIRDLSDGDDEILSNIHRVKAYGVDMQYNSYQKVIDSFDEASIVVVDSLTARIRLSDEFSDRSTLSQRSSLLGKHLEKIEDIGECLNCPVLFTNQAYQNPDSYGKNVIQYGGALIRHTAQFFVHMSSKGDIHEAEVQQHPSTGDTSCMIDIQENDVVDVS